MHFDERDEGDYRIYAGAMESPAGDVESPAGDGFVGAVVMTRWRGCASPPQEILRDERLAGGHRWRTPDQALAFAIRRGQEVLGVGSSSVPDARAALRAEAADPT